MRTGPRRTALAIGALVLAGIPAGASTLAAQLRSCPGTTATLSGTPGNDRLVGTPGDDVIHGQGGDDVLVGGGGDDVLCGGAGTDALHGGAGDDQLHGEGNGLAPATDNPPDNVGDTLVPGPGDDVVVPGHDTSLDEGGGFRPDTISLQGAPAGVRVDIGAGTARGEGTDLLVLHGRVALVGSAHDDVLVGSREDDELHGGPGDDELLGLDGDDRLEADPYDDDGARHSDPYDDRVHGGDGDDSLHLGDGDDLGRGGSGKDFISHGSGRVDILAGPGRDALDLEMEFADGQVIDGGTGRDQLYLWAVDDRAGERVLPRGRIDLATGRMRMVLGGRVRESRLIGVEELRAPDGVWTVLGTGSDETLFGPELPGSRVVVRARGGNDLLSGSPGDDVLDGGPGRDRVSVDRGRDTCISVERYLNARCAVTR